MQLKPCGRKRIHHVFAPFHHDDAAAAEVILKPDGIELIARAKPVSIKVEQRRLTAVFMDDGEGGACYIPDAARCGKRPGKGGFARAKVAEQGEESAGEQALRNARAKGFKGGLT